MIDFCLQYSVMMAFIAFVACTAFTNWFLSSPNKSVGKMEGPIVDREKYLKTVEMNNARFWMMRD